MGFVGAFAVGHEVLTSITTLVLDNTTTNVLVGVVSDEAHFESLQVRFLCQRGPTVPSDEIARRSLITVSNSLGRSIIVDSERI